MSNNCSSPPSRLPHVTVSRDKPITSLEQKPMSPRRSARLKKPTSISRSPSSPPLDNPPPIINPNTESLPPANSPPPHSPIPDPLDEITPIPNPDPLDEITPVQNPDPLAEIIPIQNSDSLGENAHTQVPNLLDEITPVQNLDPLDEITPIQIRDPLYDITPFRIRDPLDEITPVSQAPTPQKPSITPTDDESGDEITPVRSTRKSPIPLPSAQESENIPTVYSPAKPSAHVTPAHPDRTPFQALQTGQRCPARPQLVTYGKRRRARTAVEMPSSRSLGVTHDKTPGKDKAEALSEQSECDEELEEEEDVKEEEAERDSELEAFVKQQKALWQEVDAFDLEEEMD